MTTRIHGAGCSDSAQPVGQGLPEIVQRDADRTAPQGGAGPEDAQRASSKHRTVRINKVANGFIVEVGCKTFVANEWGIVAKALAEYWQDPDLAEHKYCSP